MIMRQRIGQLVTLLVSAIGAWVSITLMMIHGRTAAGDLAGAAQLCGEGSQFDCSVAASSQYSEIFGIPIAALGFAFYVAAFVSAAGANALEAQPAGTKKASDDESATVSLLLFAGFAVSVLYSIYLAYVNATLLEKSCDKCMYLYGANLVGYFATGYWAANGPIDAFGRLFRSLGSLFRSSFTYVFVVILAAALGGALWKMNDGGSTPAAPTISAEEMMDVPLVDTTVLYRDDAPTFGSPDAPIRIAEFSDFECPHCAHFAEVIGAIKREFPNDVHITFRNFPLSFHPHARLVARGAVCANEQGNFWAYHDLAFARQSTLAAEDFDVDDVVRFAEDAGLNGDELRDCVLAGFSEERVARDVEDGRAVNLRGTPTVFINGAPYNGPLDLDGFRAVINDLLEIMNDDAPAEAP